jgi:sulfur-oxidizing protein SoxZ
MPEKTIKLRAKLKGESTEVKSLIKHPMETGRRKDKTSGELIPAHFIQQVVCKHQGKVVLNADWGGSVSKNPYLAFDLPGGAAGDEVELTWTDNLGESDSATTQIR